MTRLALSAAASSLLLLGCQTTQTGDAADLKYRLPRTDIDVSLTLTLTDCKLLKADADLTIAAKAGAQDTQYEIPGKAFASNRIKRSIKISLADGVITSINASNNDRSAQIVGSVIKTAVAVAPLVAAHAYAKPSCSPDVKNAVARADIIKKNISNLRRNLAIAPGEDKDADEIDKLAKELATLRTGILQMQVAGVIKLDEAHDADHRQLVHFEDISLAKWFGDGVVTNGNLDAELGLYWFATEKKPKTKDIQIVGSGAPEPSRECNFFMPMPNVVLADVTVQGSDFGIIKSDTKKKLVVPIAQWNAPTQLCIDVGFGENREVDLSFDKFGQTTVYNWIADATAENVTGAIAGYAPDLAKLDTTLNPSATDIQNAEITRLQTQQKYNQLKACEAIIEAGGFTCPAAK